MPRPFLKKKNRGGHHVYTCTVCGEPIKAGEQYWTWKFNHGARYFQHAEHGRPKPSQLTNSKMGELYDAVEAFDPSSCESVDDIKSALADVAEAARSVGEQYGEAADGIESAWPSGNPTSEACRSTADELDSYASSLESWEPDTDEGDADDKEEWLEECRSAASDLVNDHPEYQG